MEEIETGTELTDEQKQQKDSRDFANLRRERDQLAAERDTLRTQLLTTAVKGAGFNPELGIVQRLAKEFTGELTAEAFKSFATAEGLTPTAEVSDEGTSTSTSQERTDTEQQLDQLQGQGDRLRQLSTPTDTTTIDAQKQKALEDGNIGRLLDLEIASRAR